MGYIKPSLYLENNDLLEYINLHKSWIKLIILQITATSIQHVCTWSRVCAHTKQLTLGTSSCLFKLFGSTFEHNTENWNCHNPILCNQATRECLQMIPLTKKIMGKMASMVCFHPLQRVPALCLLGQGIREQVILHNSSKFRFVWKCSHFTKFQTSWKIQIHRYK